jgi:hypothetical protein
VQIELLHPTPDVREVLEVLKLDRLITVVPPSVTRNVPPTVTRNGPPGDAPQPPASTPRSGLDFALTIMVVITLAALLIVAGIMAFGS